MANLLSDTINYILPFCRYQSANIGTNNMPIIGIANIVRNVILAAPLVWDFNRNESVGTTTLQGGVQDYALSLSDFGFLEAASVQDPSQKDPITQVGIWYAVDDIFNNRALAKSSTSARPKAVAVQNGTGPVLRFSAVPDKAYPLSVVYQKTPVQFAATTDSWAPIPDSLSDVYNNMVLGYYMDSCQDPRAPQYISRGIAGLLARQSGLSEMDKAIFAQSYMDLNSAMTFQALSTQQATQAKAAR